ncbi:MAG: hypothetical protein A2Z37_06955 [Chloroflexi bacterium RBG_19FT_COMBO_62_14]|nr:MAG: hypothetical protein A2Z37_06955 [Chloroflexi bacterium RBG_19FT_COMBO_62_14]
MSKEAVISSLKTTRESLLSAIEGLDNETMLEPGVIGDWSIKDILVHLSLWEAELVTLLWQARQGRRPTTAQLGDESVDDLNARWYQMHKDRDLAQVLDDFHAVRHQTLRRVDGFSDRELTDPELFPWLNGESLEQWIDSDSFGHEAEHVAQILTWRKSRGA